MLRVLDIVDGTTVDGPGFRTSIYFAGCRHECKGCHNPTSWDMTGGIEMDEAEILARIIDNDFNVTFSGGDPLYQAEALIPLARSIKEAGKSIWCYTGFLFETLIKDPRALSLLEYIDVLVDGPFVESLRDTGLLFRGSSNQRLIDIKKSSADSIVEWSPSF